MSADDLLVVLASYVLFVLSVVGCYASYNVYWGESFIVFKEEDETSKRG